MGAIADLKELDPRVRHKLADAGITTTDELLAQAGTLPQQEDLARQLGISQGLLEEWVNRADLMRVRGIGPELAELLSAAGITSCRELAQWDPQDLLSRMLLVDEQKHIVKHTVPNIDVVRRWPAAAAALATPEGWQRSVAHDDHDVIS